MFELLSNERVRRFERYAIILLFYEGNGVNDFPKNGHTLSPGEIIFDITSVYDMLLPRRIILLVCPLRTNGPG